MAAISVLLAAYNGEKYIQEQLESLSSQEMAIDEVIIIDDASTDRTAEIVSDYIEAHDLKDWKLLQNETNRGWKNNFMDGLLKCRGDYIFTCDQDDIWEPFKLKEMYEILEQRPEILLLASNYRTFYQKDGVTVREVTMPDTGRIFKYPLNEQLLFVKRPGCVYGIRRSIVDYIPKYGFDNYPHDAFVWRTAMLLDGLYIYERMTIRYRRHEQTATGRDKKSGVSKMETMAYYSKVVESMLRFVETEKNVADRKEKRNYILEAKQWCQRRTRALEHADVVAWLGLARYLKYYFNRKSWLADLWMLGDYKKAKRSRKLNGN